MKPSNYGYFDGAFLKLERARIHADELQKEIKAFLDKSPYQLIIVHSNQEKILRVEQIIGIPSTIPLLLGDFVHNCRSSLDHLANDLVLSNGRGISGLYFPTGADETTYTNTLYKGAINKAGDKVVEKLAKAEIYRGGKGAVIRGLHELDIADKHSMLIPNVSSVTLTNVKIGNGSLPRYRTHIKNNGSDMIITDLNQEFEFDEAINFDIEISESECFRGQSLSEAVESMFSSTYSLVESFKDDKQFPRRKIIV